MNLRKITVEKILELDHDAEEILSQLSAYKKKYEDDKTLFQYEYDLFHAIVQKNNDLYSINTPINANESKPFPWALLGHILKKVPDSFDDIAQGLREALEKLITNVIKFKGGLSTFLGGAGVLIYGIEIHATYKELKEISEEREKIKEEIKTIKEEFSAERKKIEENNNPAKSNNEDILKEKKDALDKANNEINYLIEKRNQLLTSLVMNMYGMFLSVLGLMASVALFVIGILMLTGVVAAILGAALSSVTLLGVLAAGFLTAKYFLNLLPNFNALNFARTSEITPRKEVTDELCNDPKNAFEYSDLLERLIILDKIREEIEEYKANERNKVSAIIQKMNKIKEKKEGELTEEEKVLYVTYNEKIISGNYIKNIIKKYDTAYMHIENESTLHSEINCIETQLTNFKDKNFQSKLAKYHERRNEKIEAEHKFAFNLGEFAASLTTLIGIVLLNPPVIYVGISVGISLKIFELADELTNNRPTNFFRKKFSSLGTRIADFFAPKRDTIDNKEITFSAENTTPPPSDVEFGYGSDNAAVLNNTTAINRRLSEDRPENVVSILTPPAGEEESTTVSQHSVSSEATPTTQNNNDKEEKIVGFYQYKS